MTQKQRYQNIVQFNEHTTAKVLKYKAEKNSDVETKQTGKTMKHIPMKKMAMVKKAEKAFKKGAAAETLKDQMNVEKMVILMNSQQRKYNKNKNADSKKIKATDF